jgi:hypothetical protein
VLNSYNDKQATRMLNDLEQFSKLPDCNANVGPFSVFRVDVAEPLSMTANHGDTNESYSRDDSLAYRSAPELLQDTEECSSADYVDELSMPQCGSIDGDIPEGERHMPTPSNIVV